MCVCVLQSEADGSQLSLATATTLDVCWCYPMGCHGTYLRMFHVLNVLTAIRGEEFGSVGMISCAGIERGSAVYMRASQDLARLSLILFS